jgi:hypothetical protein
MNHVNASIGQLTIPDGHQLALMAEVNKGGKQ